MNIIVYDREKREIARYENVSVEKLMQIAIDMLCYSPSMEFGVYTCVKGYISVSS